MLPCGTFTLLVVHIVSPENFGLHFVYSKFISVNVMVLKLIKQKGFLSCHFVLGETVTHEIIYWISLLVHPACFMSF